MASAKCIPLPRITPTFDSVPFAQLPFTEAAIRWWLANRDSMEKRTCGQSLRCIYFLSEFFQLKPLDSITARDIDEFYAWCSSGGKGKQADMYFENAKQVLQLILKNNRFALTVNETAMLQMVADGLTDAQIASERQGAIGSVRNKFMGILQKLGADNRAHAVALALRRGLIQ